MGSLFSSPAPPPPPPPPPPTVDTHEEDERQRRLELLDRRRRGRAGTVLTSTRGLLAPGAAATPVVGGKSLLGE